MNPYSILNSRKRALIALVHSVAFGLLAFYQFVTSQKPLALNAAHSPHLAGPVAMTSIYFIVTVVLFTLLRYSRCSLERMYFLFCASSAGVGLWRVTFGDPTLHFFALLRVLFLGCAVLTGVLIVRSHSNSLPQFAD